VVGEKMREKEDPEEPKKAPVESEKITKKPKKNEEECDLGKRKIRHCSGREPQSKGNPSFAVKVETQNSNEKRGAGNRLLYTDRKRVDPT